MEKNIYILYNDIIIVTAAKTSRGQPTMEKRAEVGIVLEVDVMMRKVYYYK